MSNRLFRMLSIISIVFDLFVINLVFIAARYLFRQHIPDNFGEYYKSLQFFINISWIIAGWLVGTYQTKNISVFELFCRATLKAYFYFFCMVFIYLFMFQQVSVSRIFVLSTFILIAFALLLTRMLHLIALQFLSSKNCLLRKIVILGYNDTAKKLISQLEGEPVKTQIIGFCDDRENIHELTNYPILGTLQQVLQVSKAHKATDIYSTITPEQNNKIYNYMEQADQECIRFRLVPNLDLFVRQPVHVDYMGTMPVLSFRQEPLNDLANRIRKRLYDILFSTFVIIFILSWLIPIISIFIWLDSPGPIFFIQKRSGINNKTFHCIKFRSMRVNNSSASQQATQNDKRVSRIGRIMRKTNLDELPQFFNVFLSDMSIVGPRPHMVEHTSNYSKVIDQYMVRQLLKPGITGWAQINGYRGETKTVNQMQGRVDYDLWYLENWSLWLDTKIIFLTVWNMVKGEKNAY